GGVGELFGMPSSRKTPTSALTGAFMRAIPFPSSVPGRPLKGLVKNASPSGTFVGGTVAWLLTPPLTLKVSTVPGTSGMPKTWTGDSSGAVSFGGIPSRQHVDPGCMPAKYGLAVPGTTVNTDSANTEENATPAISRARVIAIALLIASEYMSEPP